MTSRMFGGPGQLDLVRLGRGADSTLPSADFLATWGHKCVGNLVDCISCSRHGEHMGVGSLGDAILVVTLHG